jgi:hypothetical protein
VPTCSRSEPPPPPPSFICSVAPAALWAQVIGGKLMKPFYDLLRAKEPAAQQAATQVRQALVIAREDCLVTVTCRPSGTKGL